MLHEKKSNETITTALHSNVSFEEAEALCKMVRQPQPDRIIEIGFAHGISAATILKALEGNGRGEHVVVDPFQKQYDYAGIAMVRECRPENRLRFFEKFAEEVIPNVECSVGFGCHRCRNLFDTF